MELSGMQKMWASFYGMGFMALATLLITFARAKTKGIVRGLLSVIAFVAFLVAIVYMIFALL